MYDIILRGGSVIDGTGTSARNADVAIADGRIVSVAPFIQEAATTELDVRGRIVCPGFVDIHTHSDLTLLSAPSATSALTQGTTTQVVGNCGLGLVPRTASTDAQAVRASAAYLDLDPDVPTDWTTVAGYLKAVRAARPAVNVLTLVPHGPVRAAAVGFENRPASPRELRHMADLVEQAFQDGAAGLSTGLVYPPQCFAEDEELITLANVAAGHDRIFAWHVRDYADELIPSIEQCLRVARATGVRTQISHLSAVGQRNWSAVAQVLGLVDDGRRAGLDIGIDIYPYVAGSCPLAQTVPSGVQAGGDERLRQQMRDPAVVRNVLEEWSRRPWGWEETIISWIPGGEDSADADLVGCSVVEAALGRRCTPDELALDLLIRYGSAVLIVVFGRSEEVLETVLSHPATVVASDGFALGLVGPTAQGVPHPRSYGCFPRYLSRYGAGDLPDAIRRCTSAPALRVGLKDRGRVEPGFIADLVVLDFDNLQDTASFDQPHQASKGIDHVIVAGCLALEAGRPTGRRDGVVVSVA